MFFLRDFKLISSRENSLIKLICGLQSSAKKRHENGLFVLEGLRICQDANLNGIQFDKLIVSESAFKKLQDKISDFSVNSNECYIITDSLLKKISDTDSPQGIMALARFPKTTDVEISKTGRYIALENLSDPSNLGAISRTAEALGVDGIIISDSSCDPYSPKVLRASMGTILRLPIIIFEDFSKKISTLGLRTYSCVVDNTAEKITDVNFCDGSIIIIGNEANGISESTKAVSDMLITIPMRGKAESLNAANAASIAMWEMMK